MKSITRVLSALIVAVIPYTLSFSQASQNWYNDVASQSHFGVSSDKAYETLLKGKTSQPVIVAVIDGGTDVSHPDLKDNLWVNPREIPGNGLDDDHNGYVDDVNGWNFIGGADSDVSFDNLEIVRVYNSLKSNFEGKAEASIAPDQKADYKTFLRVKQKIDEELNTAEKNMVVYEKLKSIDDKIKDAFGEDEVTADGLAGMKFDTPDMERIKAGILGAMKDGASYADIAKEIKDGYEYFYNTIHYHYNIAFDPRSIVNDNYSDYNQRYYGNNNLAGPHAEHGTHVAGIIGASRNNGLGINGIADNVKIMVIRAVPDGDERDKDVANAIRYAADNGAKVINMSFGKSDSPGKKYVDEAVQYAASKDVLMIHAAGNDASDNDKVNNFPNPIYAGTKTRETNWIEVGAIAPTGEVASFSNYGRKSVDLFAPGVSIYSTLPDNTYDYENGTSMASPMVAGIAAVIRSYYPSLTAQQVKEVIVSSVQKPSFKTKRPGSKKYVRFRKLSMTGGVANLYNAVKAAEQLK